MNIFIDGPGWVGMWTDIIVDAFRMNGHHVDYTYHNRKNLADRLALLMPAVRGASFRKKAWQQRQCTQLINAMRGRKQDILFSIQGNLNAATVAILRKEHPGLRVLYWWGDILTDQARIRIEIAAACSDRVLVSYMGSYNELHPVFGKQLLYFPFGVSETFHTLDNLTTRDRKRFTSEVVFVGTYYPGRCELIRYLNKVLDCQIAVWGRGWRHCHGVKHQGALSLSDSLKVYHCSKVSLNLHHADTPDGCNMKFFEIPAAGGFQICDWQPVMDSTGIGNVTVSCRSLQDFRKQVHYYLAQTAARQQQITAAQSELPQSNYRIRIENLLEASG